MKGSQAYFSNTSNINLNLALEEFPPSFAVIADPNPVITANHHPIPNAAFAATLQGRETPVDPVTVEPTFIMSRADINAEPVTKRYIPHRIVHTDMYKSTSHLQRRSVPRQQYLGSQWEIELHRMSPKPYKGTNLKRQG